MEGLNSRSTSWESDYFDLNQVTQTTGVKLTLTDQFSRVYTYNPTHIAAHMTDGHAVICWIHAFQTSTVCLHAMEINTEPSYFTYT